MLVGIAATMTFAERSRAQEDPPFAFSDCAEFPLGEEALRRALSLEQTRAGPDSERRLLEVQYDCAGTALVRVSVRNEERLHRLVVRDVPRSERVRVLALALAELTYDVGAKTPTSEAPTPESPTSRGDEGADEPAPLRDSLGDGAGSDDGSGEPSIAAPESGPATNSALIAFALRTPASSDTILIGGTTTYQGRLWSVAGSLLTTRARARSATTSLGSISVLMVGANLGYLLWARDLSPARLELEAAAGAGLVRLWGTGNANVSSREVYVPYVEGRINARIRTSLRGEIAPFLELHAGRSSGVVGSAEGREVLRTGGWFLGGAFGLGF